MSDRKKKLLEAALADATQDFDTSKLKVDESVLPQPKKYEDILRKHIAEETLTGIPVVDTKIADTAGKARMAQPMELDQLRKAKLVEGGSRMAKPAELADMAGKKEALRRMSGKAGKEVAKDVAEEAGESLLKKIGTKIGGKGLGKAAAVTLAGPVGMMISGAAEAADSVPTGPEQGSIDAIIESPKYSAEEKQKMIRDIKEKERIMMRKRALRSKLRRPDALDEMNADIKRYKEIAESMDPRSPEQIEADAAEKQANIEANRPDVKQERAEKANKEMNRMILERLMRK